MDDPVFDPWGLDDEPPAAEPRKTVRWRSPDVPTSHVPGQTSRGSASRPHDKSELSTTRRPRSRLTGTPGFLRSMAAPRLREGAQRLTMARHYAYVDDLLDSPRPALRLVFRPWQSPLAGGASPEGLFEIRPDGPNGEYVTFTYQVNSHDASTHEDSIATSKLTASLLESRLVAFVTLVLDEA